MKLLKTLAAAAVLGVASFSSNATVISVGGVTWDLDYSNLTASDLFASGKFVQWYGTQSGTPTLTAGNVQAPGAVGSFLQGVGVIDLFNGREAGGTPFVCATCQLTFTFGGLKFDGDLTDGSLFDIAASQSSAFLNLYFRNTNNFSTGSVNSQTDVNKASNGTLFVGFGLNALKEQSGFTPTSGFIDSFWKATSGTAWKHFDSNGEAFNSDIKFTASAQFKGQVPFASGTGEAVGNTVPEPSSLAVLGLGLIGLAGMARRKKSA